MYKLNSVLVRSMGKACRQLAASLNVNGSSLCGSSGLQRTLCSSAVSRDETAAPGAEPVKTSSQFSIFPPLPGQDSALRWDGKKFEELPIVHVKATFNNTHIQLTDSKGLSMVRASAGTEGFKHAKKKTPLAAQGAAMTTATKATAKGVKFVRVVLKGLGPGRLSAVKGLTMGGLEVVSLTDNTPTPHNGCRPRKARKK